MRVLPLAGIALLGGLIGFALAMALKISAPGADAGDWLAAGAGAAGVMLTVLVAVAIEQHRSKWRERADRDRLVDLLRNFRDMARGVVEYVPTRFESEKERALSRELQVRLLRNMRRYRLLRERTDPVDLNLWDALMHLDELVAECQDELEAEVGKLRASRDDPAVHDENRPRAILIAAPLHEWIGVVLERAKA